MKTFQEMIVNSTLTRGLALIFLFTVIMGSTFIAGYELLTIGSMNTWISGILGVAVGSSIKILGISTGISFMNQENK
jgi:hypothetical protein